MTDPAHELRAAWRSLAGNAAPAVIDDLLRRHSESHRRYHTAEHVMWVLRHIDALLANGEGCDDDRAALVAAALFHDAIYDPRSATNEADSARLAIEQLATIGWQEDQLAEVAGLIEATAGHSATTPAAAVLLDADLAILGADPAAYAAYVAGVRDEYGHVPEDQWRTGRAAVLHHFLDRPSIYATATMATQLEQRARGNMGAELASIEA